MHTAVLKAVINVDNTKKRHADELQKAEADVQAKGHALKTHLEAMGQKFGFPNGSNFNFDTLTFSEAEKPTKPVLGTPAPVTAVPVAAEVAPTAAEAPTAPAGANGPAEAA
jgi:hypothetical protein